MQACVDERMSGRVFGRMYRGMDELVDAWLYLLMGGCVVVRGGIVATGGGVGWFAFTCGGGQGSRLPSTGGQLRLLQRLLQESNPSMIVTQHTSSSWIAPF